jgi:hypothetical protein
MLPQALDQLDRILAHQQSPPSMFVDAVKNFSAVSLSLGSCRNGVSGERA